MGNFRPARLPAAIEAYTDANGLPRGWLDFKTGEYFYPFFRPSGLLTFPSVSFSRASSGWGFVGGVLTEFTDDQPRLTDDGLMREAQALRYTRKPVAHDDWSNVGGLTNEALSPSSAGFTRRRLISGGETWHRYQSGEPTSLTSGDELHARVRYETGSSGKVWIRIFGNVSSTVSSIAGTVGSLTTDVQAIGPVSILEQTSLGANVFEVAFKVILDGGHGACGIAVTPNSDVVGEDVILHGAQLTNNASGWIVDNPSGQATRDADALEIDCAALGWASDQAFTAVLSDASEVSLSAVSGTLSLPPQTYPLVYERLIAHGGAA